MALNTYSDLKTAIANKTHRSDLTTYLDDFIDLTEAKLNRGLRMSEMESSTSVAVTTADLSLPSGFLEMREIYVSGSPDQALEYLTPHQFQQKQTSETGKPRYYTIQADAIRLFPYGSYTIKMTYYKQITALDGTNTSNFILTSHPDLYLDGCLAEAFDFMQDEARADRYTQRFMALVDEVNRKSKARKFGGVPLQVVAA